MYVLLLMVHVLIAVLLMAVVLMQSGRGGGLAGSFGGGAGNQTLFGGRGATTFLTKATWILGSGFMITSLALALTIGQRQGISRPKSVLRDLPPATAPMNPASQGGTEAPGQAPPTGQQPDQTPPSGGGSGR